MSIMSILALASGCPAWAEGTLIGLAVQVVDGDTIRVRVGNREERVRYIGINTPELQHHPNKDVELLAREAAEANRKLVGGQMVRLELDVQERDKYGRLLAYVYVGNTMVNAELVAQGYAQVITVPPNVRHQKLFLKLQREAYVLQLGLWRNAQPAPLRQVAASASPQNLPPQVAQRRPGVSPLDVWTCPSTHPIKGNFTTHSGERCIYHPPGGAFYGHTKPERCYISGEEALEDGCRASKR